MSKYLYTLIVSQYHYSHHCFVVKHDSRFVVNAISLIWDLEKHKRGVEKEERPVWLGDFSPDWLKSDNPIRQRYNVNDKSGDIYFMQSPTANYCMEMARIYFELERDGSKGYQRVKKLEDIAKHHGYSDILEIVQRHFEIV